MEPELPGPGSKVDFLPLLRNREKGPSNCGPCQTARSQNIGGSRLWFLDSKEASWRRKPTSAVTSQTCGSFHYEPWVTCAHPRLHPCLSAWVVPAISYRESLGLPGSQARSQHTDRIEVSRQAARKKPAHRQAGPGVASLTHPVSLRPRPERQLVLSPADWTQRGQLRTCHPLHQVGG